MILLKKKEGNKGFFTRGLYTRLLTNGIQGLMFNVMWKYFGKSNVKLLTNGNANFINNFNNNVNKNI